MISLNWEKLTEITDTTLERGTTFRLPAKYPYEDVVDFMLIEESNSDSGFALMVTSGYKAGLILVCLPKEAQDALSEHSAVSVKWLIENWQKWIYELGPKEVYIRKKYYIEEDWKQKSC